MPRVLLLLASLAAAPAAFGQQAEQLEREHREHEEALERLRDRESSVFEQLEGVERELAALEESAAKAEEEARLAGQKAAAAQREADEAKAELVALLDQLSPRLKARYQLSKQRQIALLSSAHSVGELVNRKRALDALLAQDLKVLARARASVQKVQARHARLEQARREEARQSQAAGEQRASARKRRDALSALQASIENEAALRERTLEEIERAQRKLNKLVAGLPGEAGQGMAARRGRLPFPAPGLIEVGFGKVVNPKFNTVTFQKGIDLRAPHGAPVIAVAPGKIVHAGPFRGYGNLVIVDHGDGYHSLYAHLAGFTRAVGEAVEEGTALGKVGDTGSLKGAYLYFEIREKGKPVDPKPWLAAR